MNRKLPEDLVTSNEEYAKLRADTPDDRTPREAPRRQAPGMRGLRRPELEAWTTEELRRAATTLGTPNAEEMRRDELVEALLAAEIAAVTGRRSES